MALEDKCAKMKGETEMNTATNRKPHARDRGIWDRMVNDKFNGKQPILSPEESIAAARKLYRHAMGKAFEGEVKLTSGNRYTWVRRRVLSVNPDKQERSARGLRALIHDLSHYCHRRLHPLDSAHSIRQARIERNMVDFAIKRGCWLDGTLKREPAAPKPKPDSVKLRYERMVRRRDKYAAEIERARRLHIKAQREVREYERRHGDRLK